MEVGRSVEIQGTIPHNIREEESLIFQTHGNRAEVFIEGHLIYSYATNGYFCGSDFCETEMLLSIYCIVPIPAGSEGMHSQ